MSVRTVWVGACCAALAALSGCNNARVVRWDGAGGVVAIPSNTNAWPEHNRDNAEALMKQKCPQGYTVVNEEEVVVGQVQHTQTNTEKKGDPLLAAVHLVPMTEQTNQTTTYTDRKEWRITFRASNAPPPSVLVPEGPPPVEGPRGGLPSQPVPIAH